MKEKMNLLQPIEASDDRRPFEQRTSVSSSLRAEQHELSYDLINVQAWL